jgi:hypothetical protein
MSKSVKLQHFQRSNHLESKKRNQHAAERLVMKPELAITEEAFIKLEALTTLYGFIFPVE